MRVEEAQWFHHCISRIEPHKIFPMLNIGSSTKIFRESDQPWIDEYIFRPFREHQYKVVHTDIKTADGVDIVGDLLDTSFIQKLSDMHFKSIFSTNLLEHVYDRKTLARSLLSIIPQGGYLFISCPYRFPYHKDPFDNLYRPNIQQLAALFPHTTLLHGEVINSRVTWISEMKQNTTREAYNREKMADKVKMAAEMIAPSLNPQIIMCATYHLLSTQLFQKYKITCIVLEKN
jgi:hypothetical protein